MTDGNALILGGTRGLGLELARVASQRGMSIVVVGRSVHEAAVRSSLPEGARRIRVDFSDPGTTEYLQGLSFQKITHVFWVAGVFLRRSFFEMTRKEIETMTNVHLVGPTLALQRIFSFDPAPKHLVAIASTSSWRLRKEETLYCALKAAKAHLVGNLAREIRDRFPGTRITLVNPGGMRTPEFWSGSKQDIGNFMDPSVVARLIWTDVVQQGGDFLEMNIERRGDTSEPVVTYGPRLRESPHRW